MTAAHRLLAYDPNDVRPGWGALVLILVLALVTYLLWRSMNTQLGRIQMPPRQRPSSAADGGAGGGSSSASAPDPDGEDPDSERPPQPSSD